MTRNWASNEVNEYEVADQQPMTEGECERHQRYVLISDLQATLRLAEQALATEQRAGAAARTWCIQEYSSTIASLRMQISSAQAED